MDAKKRFELVKRNTEEIISESELKALLKKKKHPGAYIGLAITGKPHIGYFIPMVKVSDFLKSGFRFKILFAAQIKVKYRSSQDPTIRGYRNNGLAHGGYRERTDRI